ncbi:MAG: hypothetical protein AB7U73_13350 [Pirellulales bacterium]
MPRLERPTRCLILHLFVAAFLVGCGRGQAPPRPSAARFSEGALRLEFAEPVTLDGVMVTEADGAPVAWLSAAGNRRLFELPFRWRPGARYRVDIERGAQVVSLTLQAPAARSSLSARLEAPPGQDAAQFGHAAETGLLVPPDGRAELAVVIVNNFQSAAKYELAFEPDEQVSVSQADSPAHVEGAPSPLQVAGKLQRQFDYDVQTIAAQLVAEAKSGQLRVTFRQATGSDGDDARHVPLEQLTVTLRRATPAELADRITCDRVVFPVDRTGQAQPERLAGTIVLANPVWSTMRRWVWPSDPIVDRHAPYGAQAIYLTNHADVALNLVVRSEVRDAATGEPLLAFAPPAFRAPSQSPTSVHLLRLRGGETAAAVVPIYARPDVPPGHYERRIEVSVLGATDPLVARNLPLEVQRGDPLVSTVAAGSFALSLLVWLALPLAARPIVRSVGIEGLTTIALVAGLYFAASYTSRLAGDALAAVTGPFYVFFAGIGNEGLTSLLWATLIVLLPRVGTILLASLVVFLLQAVFTGQFGIVDLLFVSVSIALAEVALAVAGVTTSSRFATPRVAATQGQVLRVAAALGCANAATLFSQYCLIEVLHRLYFATWYVVSVSLLTGLVYGAVGAAIGTRFGFRLRRTAR